MSLINTQRWESLERRRPTLFLLAGVLFGLNVALVASVIATSADSTILVLGEAFNAAGWALALVGLLGFYPGLAERSPWLARAGVVCAVIGVVVFIVLSVMSVVYGLELVEGSLESLVPLILPGVLLGGVVSFLLFGVASLRTDGQPARIGLLLVVPSLITITNIGIGAAGVDSSYTLLGIVSGLLVVMLAIAFGLQASTGRADRGGVSPESSAK